MATIEITTDNFEDEVTKSEKTVLLDFSAVWCGPCARLAPIIDEIACEHPEIKVGKVDTDKQPALAQRFSISSIPALLVFKDGQLSGQSVGLVSKERVEELIS